jgi:hypothetical protein
MHVPAAESCKIAPISLALSVRLYHITREPLNRFSLNSITGCFESDKGKRHATLFPTPGSAN